MSKRDPALAERLRDMRAGRYGPKFAERYVVLLAGALSGDLWERRRLEGQFPEICALCEQKIRPGDAAALERDGGRLAHSACASAPQGAFMDLSPDSALRWLSSRRADQGLSVAL
jgi:hypothetical protein